MPSAHPNRFGHTFRKGQIVKDHRGYTFRYVKLAPWDDFSRAYGRQAIVCWDTSGPLTEDHEVGYHDLRPVGSWWSVVVGNVGTVYAGESEAEARETFARFVDVSAGDMGRAAGEPVYLICDGEPVEEYDEHSDDC